MKIGIFGVNMKMTDMVIYWDENVNMDDMMDDLAIIGEMMNTPRFQKKGCRISTVRTNWINDTKYRTCEVVVDKELAKEIENKAFKAVRFTKTFITKK